MRIVVTGASGFVGRNLVRFFGRNHRVTFTFFQSTVPSDIRARHDGIQMDIRRPDEVKAVLEKTLPDVVIHAAGNKNVRYCEDNPHEAQLVNAEGTRNVARTCKALKARMVYLSTDLVFDCERGGYTETSIPTPTTAYGKSKLAGEQLALEELPELVICRSGGIYGPESPLLGWLAKELTGRREVLCLTNVKNTPTYVEALGKVMQQIIERNMSGIFHTVGSDVVSRFEFFHAFATAFDFDPSLLRPIESEKLMKDMLLQPNASLDSSWTDKVLASKGLSLQEGMAAFKSVASHRILSGTS